MLDALKLLKDNQEKISSIVSELLKDKDISHSIADISRMINTITKDETDDEKRFFYIAKSIFTLVAIYLEDKKIMLIK